MSDWIADYHKNEKARAARQKQLDAELAVEMRADLCPKGKKWCRKGKHCTTACDLWHYESTAYDQFLIKALYEGKELCKYGFDCYRKNPQHLAQYCHPN